MAQAGVAVSIGNQKGWVGNYESATKKGWVGNQNRSESATKSAESGTMSRQLRKSWFGNQKTNIVGN